MPASTALPVNQVERAIEHELADWMTQPDQMYVEGVTDGLRMALRELRTVREHLTPSVEPAIGSVVLDAHGLAWQRDRDGLWVSAGHAWGSITWDRLLTARGPVTLLADGATPMAGRS